MSIRQNLEKIRQEIPDNVTLVAVSKTMPVSAILEAYGAGQRHFGENRVQELILKQPQLPDDILWHMIGHLQTNKVKYIISFVHLIHSVDSWKLMQVINREAGKLHKIQDCLFEMHIAEEESKFGFAYEELLDILRDEEWKNLQNIRWRGVMGMATFTDDILRVKREFGKLKEIFHTLSRDFFAQEDAFSEISIGMSGDYQVAIEEGSTMVRIGTKIFGARH